MTRKDYIKIADAIKDNKQGNWLDGLIDDLCIILKQDNARFDDARFRDYINEERKEVN